MTAEDLKIVPDRSGIYRLMESGVCLWVGSSLRLRTRLQGHYLRKRCDQWEWMTVPIDRLQSAEQAWMDKYKPTLNQRKALRPAVQFSKSRCSFQESTALLEIAAKYADRYHALSVGDFCGRLLREHLQGKGLWPPKPKQKAWPPKEK